MTILEALRLVFGVLFLAFGLFIFISAVVGNYRFHFVLSRMQASSLADTLGLLFVLLGAMLLAGHIGFALKLLLIIVFMWLTGPVSSHLLVQMELLSGKAGREEEEA